MRSGVAANTSAIFLFCVLFAALTANGISAGTVSARGTAGPVPVPLDVLLQFWKRGGEYYLYPGNLHPKSFDAALWAKFRSMRTALQAVRRRKRFCMVQLLGPGMINYTASAGKDYLSLLFDPRAKGALLLSREAPSLFGFLFSLNAKHTRPILAMGNGRKPAPRIFGILLWHSWYRVVSRYCQRFSYDGHTNTIRIQTSHKGVTTRWRFVFSVGNKKVGSRLEVSPSEIDCWRDSRGVVSSEDLRLAAGGIFPAMPNRLAKKLSSRIAGINIRAVTRAQAWTIFLEDLKLKGKMSARAAAARLRFLKWAVGRKEAGKLDGWVDKGIAPFSPAGKKIAGGAK